MSWLLTFLGIVVLIVLHELGHFAVAKAVGMRVERFSLFFPPRIFGVKIGETEYALGALPLGGYVKIAGMAPLERMPAGTAGARRSAPRGPAHTGRVAAASARGADPRHPPMGWLAGGLAGAVGDTDDAGRAGRAHREPSGGAAAQDDPRGYFRAPVWKRMAVIAAGPGMNVLVAFLILWGVYALSPQRADPRALGVRIAEVQPGAPAAAALHRGEVVLAVDGQAVRYQEKAGPGADTALARAIGSHRCAGELVNGCRAATPVRLTLQRGDRERVVALHPLYDAAAGRMLLGFSYGPRRLVSDSLGEAASASLSKMWNVTSVTVSRIGQVFTSEHARREVHGIVGISDVASQAFAFSVPTAFLVLALISLSLAIVNLFPFLPLDGGHLFWAAAEKVRGRAIPFWVMERASVVGFLLVGFLFIVGLSNDISALQNGSLTLHH